MRTKTTPQNKIIGLFCSSVFSLFLSVSFSCCYDFTIYVYVSHLAFDFGLDKNAPSSSRKIITNRYVLVHILYPKCIEIIENYFIYRFSFGWTVLYFSFAQHKHLRTLSSLSLNFLSLRIFLLFIFIFYTPLVARHLFLCSFFFPFVFWMEWDENVSFDFMFLFFVSFPVFLYDGITNYWSYFPLCFSTSHSFFSFLFSFFDSFVQFVNIYFLFSVFVWLFVSYDNRKIPFSKWYISVCNKKVNNEFPLVRLRWKCWDGLPVF